MGQKSECNGNVSYHWILEFCEGIHMDTDDTVAEKGKSKEQILAWQTRKKLLLISYYI